MSLKLKYGIVAACGIIATAWYFALPDKDTADSYSEKLTAINDAAIQCTWDSIRASSSHFSSCDLLRKRAKELFPNPDTDDWVVLTSLKAYSSVPLILDTRHAMNAYYVALGIQESAINNKKEHRD